MQLSKSKEKESHNIKRLKNLWLQEEKRMGNRNRKRDKNNNISHQTSKITMIILNPFEFDQ